MVARGRGRSAGDEPNGIQVGQTASCQHQQAAAERRREGDFDVMSVSGHACGAFSRWARWWQRPARLQHQQKSVA